MPFPVDIKYIQEAETRLGAVFPIEYTEFMCALNGGEFVLGDEDWILYPVADTSDRKRISRTANHLELETNEWRKWDGTPEGAICVADNQVGDKLVMLRDGDRYLPSIYKWDHETRDLHLVARRIREIDRC